MASIVPFWMERAFDPVITKAMGDAFDAACADLNVRTQTDLLKEVIAKQIILAASDGERDAARLCARALDAIGIGSRCP
jgi:hypothetical protein